MLYSAAFLRALATGLVSVLLGIYVAKLGFSPTAIGVVVGAGLFGSAASALVATLFADRIGRRRVLVAVVLLCTIGAFGLAASDTPAAATLAAFFGLVNGMGRDRAAALVIEQAILPSTVNEQGRTRAFAVYNVAQDIGHALGGLLAGMVSPLRDMGIGDIDAMRLALVVYGLLYLAVLPLYLRLPATLDAPRGTRVVIAPQSRRVLFRLSALFAVDSLAGGFLTTSLLAFFFFSRFGAADATVGALFFGARVLNAVSHLGAAYLAGRFGLVNTMVFTHIPAGILLMTVPFAPTFAVAAILFLLREGLVEMDVPTRQSYVMAVVRPEERTFASGITNLVRVCAWAIAPSLAGAIMTTSMSVPLLLGGGMKIAYDVLLWISFRRLRPPEEAVADHG